MLNRSLNAVIVRSAAVAAALLLLALAAGTAFAATSVSYAENGTEPVATFSATDQDGDAIVWSLDGADKGDFTIDGGVLSFKSPPNYESPVSESTGTLAEKNVYKVTVKATGGEEKVTVTVTNVDEAGTASLTQYQPQVGRSLVASVSDPDSDETNQKWQWARGASAAGPFTDIDGATNPSRSPVSADNGMYLRASVTYTDSFGSGKTASVVSDNAVEDTTLFNAAPSFEGQDQTGPTVDDDPDGVTGVQDHIIVSRSVAEGTAVGAAIGKPVTAADDDGDVLIYTLDWSPDLNTGTTGTAAAPSGTARFTIDRSTGQIKVGKKLNYESASAHVDRAESGALTADAVGGAIAVSEVTANDAKYVLRVRATDPSGAYANVNVTITLTDANEAPTFAEASADPRTAVTVVENTTALLEPDADDTDGETGAAALTDPLAADTFVATDQDTREERPDNDDTTTADAIVSYALEGADAKYFSIGNDSTDTSTFGVLTIDADQDNDGTDDYKPDFEKQSSYSITIVATSGTGERRLAGRLDVTVKVTNAEDAGSVTLSQIEPREGLPVTADLVDKDGSVNISAWKWEYAPLDGTEVCNPGTGQSGPADADWIAIPKATSASYTPKDFVSAGATVQIDGNCLRATATYTDGIADSTGDNTEPDTAVEETDAVVQAAGAANAAPKFPDQDLTTPGDQSDSTSLSVAENTDAGTAIESAVAAGDGDDDLLLYTLGGADAASFGIDRRTGQVKTKAALDYETKDTYTVTVTATDPSGASDSIMVTINVTDVNDTADITGGKSVSYPENGTDPVATFSATDQDGDAIVWSLDGADKGDFTIDGGVLSFKSPPNYESPVSESTGTLAEKNVYRVTVKATGGEEKVTVTVTNVDEAGTASLTQYQPQVGRSLVASVSDPDSDETNQKWQWARGASAAGPFTDIDGATNPSRSPVSADNGMYLRASVTYTDSFGSGKTASVVSDNAVEDTTLFNAAPSFEGQDQTGPTVDDDPDGVTGVQDHIIVSRSVAEGTAVGAAIGKPVTAADDDGDVLIYTLDWSPDLNTGTTGTAAAPSGTARFTIDRSTGQIKVGKKLNYESASAHVDRAESGALTADAVGGAIAVSEVTANDAKYVLRVRATDPSGAYANVNVTITLTDANEAPTFAEASKDPRTAVTVVENTTQLLQPATGGTANLAAATFRATDQDTREERPDNDDATTADAIVSYALEGADAKYFSIGNDSTEASTFGVLTIDTDQDNDGTDDYKPDYEKQDTYSITIVATSGTGERRLAGRLDVTVKVTNAEDAGSVTLSQIEPREGLPVTADLVDKDGSVNISAWKWEYAPLDGTEVCNPGTGQSGPADTDWIAIPKATSASYTPKDFVSAGATVQIDGNCLRATATYTDGIADSTGDNTEPDTAVEETDAVVQAAGAANAAPKFPDQDLTTPGDQSDSTSLSVAENTDAGTSIGSAVSAGDGDDDLLLYTLGGADAASFGIDRRTGQVKTKAALDYETKNTYTVTVTATDPSGATDTISVTINVTDVNDGATITVGPAVNTAPAFDSDTAERMVDENMAAGANVGDPVTATDEDQHDTIAYSLNGGGGNFGIGSASGQITTTASLDYEATSSYTVTVTASDGEDSDTIEVTIAVGDAHPGCTAEGNTALTNDCEVLLDAMDTLNGVAGELDWSDDTPIGEWKGVEVSGDPMRVTELKLHGQSLDGSIPGSLLGSLSELEKLFLHNNKLHGMIPGELGMLKNLEELRLYRNELEGIETGLGGASSLTRFWAHANHLRGSIPDDLGDLENLEWLRLDSQISSARPDDGLTGSIPAALVGLDSIDKLYLHRNKLSGSIPSGLGESTSLRYIRLDQNDLTGGIPDLSGMTSLVWLGLYSNDLTGGIPATLGMLSNLERLYLHKNDLTGSVPAEIANLSALTNLWLKHNRLTGALPNELNGLTNLERVRIEDNNFTGCIPAALANAASSDAAKLGLETCASGN